MQQSLPFLKKKLDSLSSVHIQQFYYIVTILMMFLHIKFVVYDAHRKCELYDPGIMTKVFILEVIVILKIFKARFHSFTLGMIFKDK